MFGYSSVSGGRSAAAAGSPPDSELFADLTPTAVVIEPDFVDVSTGEFYDCHGHQLLLCSTPYVENEGDCYDTEHRKHQVKRKLYMDDCKEEGFKTPKSKIGRSPARQICFYNEPESPFNKSERGRSNSSLVLLTKKFVGLLHSSPDGVVDLNSAAVELGVQKRRIYDITNVLEGIDVVAKKSKNHIQWKADSSDTKNTVKGANTGKVKSDIADLSEMEQSLDQLLNFSKSNLERLTSDPENAHVAYVTYQDIRRIETFDDHTIIAIRAPPNTRLELSDPSEGNQMKLKSTNGPIDVYLCPDGCSDNDPDKESGVSDDLPLDSQSVQHVDIDPLFNITPCEITASSEPESGMMLSSISPNSGCPPYSSPFEEQQLNECNFEQFEHLFDGGKLPFFTLDDEAGLVDMFDLDGIAF